jgi:dTDP-4-amino-4,6-dideoxygalactose transaminase
MRIGRTVPPAAAPLGWMDLWHGLAGLLRPNRAIDRLDAELRRHFRVRHVFLVSSGTAALTLVFRALRSESDRREVVIPAYTCFSVPAAALEAGLRPALCDIAGEGFDFDHQQLDPMLGSNTLCVVAHHLFGVASDVDRVRALCRARGIVVVEDAAQAMGVRAQGRLLGTLGDVGIFSLGRGKNITCGDGGIVVTNDDRIAAAIGRQCRGLPGPSFVDVLAGVVALASMAAFIRPSLYWIPASLPFLRLGETIFPKRIPLKRLSGLQAGALRDWPRRLTRSNEQRSETSAYFSRRLALATGGGPRHPYLRLPMVLPSLAEASAISSFSRRRGLGVSPGYPAPVNEIPEIRHLFAGTSFPAARAIASRLLTLPTHQWLTRRDRDAIVTCIETFSRAARPPAAWQKTEGAA